MKIVLVFISLVFSILAELKSTSGSLKFDVDSDSSTDLELNEVGLGVGITPEAKLHVNGNMVVDQLSVGSTVGHSNLMIAGTMAMSLKSASADFVVNQNSVTIVDTQSGNLTVELPNASEVTGRVIYIKKKGTSNTLWVSSNNLIDKKLSHLEMTVGERSLPYVKLISNGVQWYILSHSEDMREVTAASNLMAWWKLDETSGEDVKDDSLQNHHGDLLGASFSFSTNSLAGKIDQALNFNGTSDYVEVPFASEYNTTAFTVSFWAKVKGGSSYRAPVSNRQSGTTGGFIFYVAPGNNWEFWTGKGSNWNRSVGPSVSIGSWTFITGTFDGTDQNFYINGELVDTDAFTVNTNMTRNLRIGAGRNESTPIYYFPGDIDDVKVYNRALTLSEISNLKNEKI